MVRETDNRAKALTFLGRPEAASEQRSSGVLAERVGENRESPGQIGVGLGGDTGPVDAGAVDLAAVSEKRRGGRQKGYKWSDAQRAAHAARTKAKTEEVALDKAEPAEVPPDIIGQVALGLVFLHALGPAEMALSEVEATQLARALTNVGRYYVAFKVNNRGAAWLALVVTCGMIYIPRLKVLADKANKEKDEARARAASAGEIPLGGGIPTG